MQVFAGFLSKQRNLQWEQQHQAANLSFLSDPQIFEVKYISLIQPSVLRTQNSCDLQLEIKTIIVGCKMYNPGFLDLERASDKSNQRKVSKIFITFSAYIDAYLSPYIYENKGVALH